MFIFLFILFVTVIGAWLGFWSLVSIIANNDPLHRQFMSGRLPDEPPNGLYRGTLHIFVWLESPWLGKFFDGRRRTGHNLVSPAGAELLRLVTPLYQRFRPEPDGSVRVYDFTTRVEPGIKDKNLQVLRIDYGLNENPFLIRLIADEIVETAPGEYLGKFNFKVFPHFYSTIGYFSLRRE